MGTIYGYARVSTREQNLDRQLDALRAFGIAEADIWRDKASGKDFDRPAWRELSARLRAGDALVVKSIDRLGRDYDDIIGQWRRLTKEVGCDIVVLDMPLLDTRETERGIAGTAETLPDDENFKSLCKRGIATLNSSEPWGHVYTLSADVASTIADSRELFDTLAERRLGSYPEDFKRWKAGVAEKREEEGKSSAREYALDLSAQDKALFCDLEKAGGCFALRISEFELDQFIDTHRAIDVTEIDDGVWKIELNDFGKNVVSYANDIIHEARYSGFAWWEERAV